MSFATMSFATMSFATMSFATMTDDGDEGFAGWREDARAWCAGRQWRWRAAVLLVLGWQAAR